MRNWRDLSIRSRLLLGFGLAATLTLLVALVAISSLRSLGQNLSSVAEQDRLLQSGAIELRLAVEQESDAVRGYLLTGTNSFLDDSTTARAAYTTKLGNLSRLVTPTETKNLLADVDSLHSKFVGIAQEQTTLRDMGFGKAAVFLWQTQGNAVKVALDSRLVDLIARQENVILSHAAQARLEENRTLFISLSLVFLTWIVVILGWLWTSRSITRPIAQLVRVTEDIGNGKLDAKAPASGNDELSVLGGAMNRMAGELAQLYQQARELSALEERQRLARELHDAVTQTLFSASLIAEVLPKLWEKNPAEGRKRLEELRQCTRGALAEMRMLLLELRPAALAEMRLEDSLRHLADAVAGRARLAVSFSMNGQGDLSPEVKLALYRVAQEALNNVVKHSKATQASLRLAVGAGTVQLTVSDNGVGFDTAAASPNRLGLRIMRERAEGIGASVGVESQPNRGTTVSIDWTDRKQSHPGQAGA